MKLRHTDDSRYMTAWMVIAMAHYRLGRMDEVRTAFAEGVKLAQTKVPDLRSEDLGDGWQNPLIAHILMREAKALIEGNPQTNSGTK